MRATGPVSKKQTAAMGAEIQIVGDDLFVTNTKFIGRGIEEKSANAVLIKLNQIGTVTETIEAIKLCREVGWHHTRLYRALESLPGFRQWFTQQESIHKRQRDEHRWNTHPMRGYRPPRPTGQRSNFPRPRFSRW